MNWIGLDSFYFPNVEYFVMLREFDGVLIDTEGYYKKQTFRNRTQIMAANGVQQLVIPVRKTEDMKMQNVRVDNSQKWQQDHWRAILSAYNRSPYFIHYKDQLQELMSNNYDRLVTLNTAILTFCLNCLKWNQEIVTTDQTGDSMHNSAIIDHSGLIETKKSFVDRGILRPVEYYQVFGKTFVPNLSIIDLLFCEGPYSGEIIKSSSLKLNK